MLLSNPVVSVLVTRLEINIPTQYVIPKELAVSIAAAYARRASASQGLRLPVGRDCGKSRVVESNGVFLGSSLGGKEWICFPLPANGRFRTVTWIDDDIIAQGENLRSHIA